MPRSTKEFLAELTARTILRRLRAPRSFGVFVENIPLIDTQRLIDTIASEDGGFHMRLAVLGTALSLRARGNIDVTTSPTEANVWRNDSTARSGVPMAVVIVGPAPKVNSLRTTFSHITQADLRAEIGRAASALRETPERTAFWNSLVALTSEVSLQQLAALANDVFDAAQGSRAEFLGKEWKLVYHVGLLPQQQLLTTSGPRSATNLIIKNRAFVTRLRSLSARDRGQLLRVLEDGRTSDARREAAKAVLRFEKRGDVSALQTLDMDVVQVLFRADAPRTEFREPPQPEPEEQVARVRLDGDALALDYLLTNRAGAIVAAERFAAAIEPEEGIGDRDQPETITVNKREIVPRLKTGSTQATGLFGRILSEEVWGGILDAPNSPDFVASLKLMASGHVDVVEFCPLAEQNLRWMLARAVNQGLADASVLSTWDELAAVRARLLPHSSALIDHPLLALSGKRALRADAEELLKVYARLLSGVSETADRLRKAGSIEPAKRLFAYALCLDIAFVHSSSEWVGVVAPTHPFHLWRWLTLLDVLSENRHELAALGTEVLEPLVSDPPASAPDIVLSPFAGANKVSRTMPFVPIGSFGALPLFGEPSARQSAKFRARSLAQIAARLIRLMPHASLGLRVFLVDPPSVSGALEDLLSLQSAFDDQASVPLHVSIARTRLPREGTDEEDLELEVVAREIRDAGGTLTVLATLPQLGAVAAEVRDAQPHLAVVFDPGEAQELRIGVASPPALSPLLLPRAYRYDPFDDRLDVVVAGNSALFTSYHDIFCEVLDIPRSDYVGRRSGASRFARDLEQIANAAMWMVVVDQGVEPTLRVNGAVRLDWRSDAGRDLVTFTAHYETVEELVEDAIRAVGLMPTEETVKRTIRQILQLSGEALLALAKPRPDVTLTDRRIAKGILGTVAAARWYGATYSDAILISLDEPASRRWILGSNDDGRHGDLLGIRQSPDGIVVDSIEVKAHDDPDGSAPIRNGRVEGRAAVQVDQTIRILRRILVSDDLPAIDRARRDVLKDQLYKAVASRPYEMDQRARLVQMLEELFARGPREYAGLIVRVKLRSGVDVPEVQRPTIQLSPADNRVGVLDLVESELGLPRGEQELTPSRSTVVPDVASGGISEDVADDAASRVQSASSGSDHQAGDDATPHEQKGKEAEGSTNGRENRLRFLVGTTASGDQVTWDPQLPTAPLNNFGFLVTGDSGSGKTQILRALIADVAHYGLPVCIFDFKNDYSDTAFAQSLGLRVFDIERDGLPFNPLSLVSDENGEGRPIAQIHEVAAILRRIFKLGDQQEALLKRAIQQAFTEIGVKVTSRQNVDALPAPSFDDVVNILVAEGKQSVALLNRLSPLFDLGLFPSEGSAKAKFEAMIASGSVIDLHKLPSDAIKAALAEFMIVRLHGYALRGSQPRQLRRLLVLDEAWRVKDSNRLEELAREGRAFGVGIAIGTQFPGDLPENLAGNLATQLLLHNGDVAHRQSVARTLVGSASGPVANQVIIQTQALAKHEGFFRNQQYSPYVLVQTIPHYLREG
jgi:hypothetical protein